MLSYIVFEKIDEDNNLTYRKICSESIYSKYTLTRYVLFIVMLSKLWDMKIHRSYFLKKTSVVSMLTFSKGTEMK